MMSDMNTSAFCSVSFGMLFVVFSVVKNFLTTEGIEMQAEKRPIAF